MSGRRPRRATSRRSVAATPEHVATVEIASIASGGDGVARLDGMAVFVPRTAPGDRVQIAYRTQGRLARGRVLQVLTPSVDRVAPACMHYDRDRCGGCQLQHLSAPAQRAARQQIVSDTLRRIGKREVPLPSITSDVQWGYRGRLTLALRRHGRHWIGGLHAFDDVDRIFPLEVCPIAHPRLVNAWRALRDRQALAHLPEAPALRLALRLDADAQGDGVAVVVEGATSWVNADAFAMECSALDDREPDVSDAALSGPPHSDDRAGAVTAVWWIADGGSTRQVWRRAEATTASETPSADLGDGAADPSTLGDTITADRSVLAFAQINERVANALRERVHSAVMAFDPARVIDAYAGTGAFARRLATEGVAVTAIEADPAAATAALNAAANGAGADAAVSHQANRGVDTAHKVQVVCDQVERALPAVSAAAWPDVVILNPPRRGVDQVVATWLDEAPSVVRGVVYVSCDPATLARDVARLTSWQIRSLECFDMFPQTAHVETVCVLQRSPDLEAA